MANQGNRGGSTGNRERRSDAMAPTPRTPPDNRRPAPDQGQLPPRQRSGVVDTPPRSGGGTTSTERRDGDDHEGATDDQVSDRTGPAVGYDQERQQEKDEGGVN